MRPAATNPPAATSTNNNSQPAENVGSGNAMLVAATSSGAKSTETATSATPHPLDKVAPLIPRRVLFGNPEKAMARMSHDGKRLGVSRAGRWRAERLGRADRRSLRRQTGDARKGSPGGRLLLGVHQQAHFVFAGRQGRRKLSRLRGKPGYRRNERHHAAGETRHAQRQGKRYRRGTQESSRRNQRRKLAHSRNRL